MWICPNCRGRFRTARTRACPFDGARLEGQYEKRRFGDYDAEALVRTDAEGEEYSVRIAEPPAGYREPPPSRIVTERVVRVAADAGSSTEDLLTSARSAIRVPHPHVRGVHGFGWTNEEVGWVLFDSLDETLDERIARAPLSGADLTRFGSQLASALAAAHAAGVHHPNLDTHCVGFAHGRPSPEHLSLWGLGTAMHRPTGVTDVRLAQLWRESLVGNEPAARGAIDVYRWAAVVLQTGGLTDF